jgi:hypothetical protein
MTDQQLKFNQLNPIVIDFAEQVHMTPHDLARHPAMSSVELPGTGYPVRFLTLGFMQWFSNAVGQERFRRVLANPDNFVMKDDWREDASEDDQRSGVVAYGINLATDDEITNAAKARLDEIASLIK